MRAILLAVILTSTLPTLAPAQSLEQQWAWAMGWKCGSPLFRDGAAGCLEVGEAARRAMPPAPPVAARRGSGGG